MPSDLQLQKIKNLLKHLGRFQLTDQESIKERRAFVKKNTSGSKGRPSSQLLSDYAKMCHQQKEKLD